MGDSFQLRVYSFLDRMQPEYAAFVGTITQGDLPTAAAPRGPATGRSCRRREPGQLLKRFQNNIA